MIKLVISLVIKVDALLNRWWLAIFAVPTVFLWLNYYAFDQRFALTEKIIGFTFCMLAVGIPLTLLGWLWFGLVKLATRSKK